jgi:hypothetical protein
VHVTGVGVSSSGDVNVVVALDGTVLHVDSFSLGTQTFMPQPWQRDIDIEGEVLITDHLDVSGIDLMIDFTPDPVMGQPAVATIIPRHVVTSAPALVAYLAQAAALGQAAYDQLVALFLTSLQDAITAVVRAQVRALGPVVLARGPAMATRLDLLTNPASLRLLYTLGGTPGNPAAITRTRLLSGISGTVDAAAVTVSNACFLRDFIRPAVALMIAPAPPGSPPGAPSPMLPLFSPTHPCFFAGGFPITPPGGLPAGVTSASVGFVLAGIDDSGMLRIVVRVDATGIQGLFTADVRIDVAVGMAASVAGGAITLTPGTPAVTSTPTIHVTTLSYLLLAFAGTPIGPIMDQAISTIILSFFPAPTAPAFPAPPPITTALPGRVPGLGLRLFSSFQADSARRSILLGGGISIPDPFRSHDLFLNLV